MTSLLLKPAPPMSSTLAINQKISALTAEGQQIFHLGFGEARFPVHPKILTEFKKRAVERSYLPVAGLPALRTAAADYYRRHFEIEATAEQVIVGSGSKSLLFAALYAIDGDLLLPQPSWVSYEAQAQLSHKAVTWIPTYLDDNLCLTAAGFQAGIAAARAAGQSPRVLILNTPHNPSGVMYTPALLAELAEISRAEGIAVISDEIYAQTAYAEIPHRSMACYYPEGTIVTGGLSKHLSLGGWRLGVAVLPANEFGEQLHRYMVSVASSIWTTAAAPVQYAAVVAYSADPDIERYIQTCAAIHGDVTGYLFNVLRELGVPCPKPSGGFYLYPNYSPWREALAEKHGVHTSQELAHFLLDEEHIAALPGSAFGADPQDLSLRMATSYLYAMNDVEAETMLETYTQGLPQTQFLAQACPQVIELGERFKTFVAELD